MNNFFDINKSIGTFSGLAYNLARGKDINGDPIVGAPKLPCYYFPAAQIKSDFAATIDFGFVVRAGHSAAVSGTVYAFNMPFNPAVDPQSPLLISSLDGFELKIDGGVYGVNSSVDRYTSDVSMVLPILIYLRFSPAVDAPLGVVNSVVTFYNAVTKVTLKIKVTGIVTA